MAFCLPIKEAEKFIEALKGGKIVPEKLASMSSLERRAYFEQLVGRDSARDVNALFESKLLLKDQKRGLVTWAKQITGIKESVRKDLISKIEKMDKVLNPETERAFLEDLVAKRIGADVTLEEAKVLSDSVKDVAKKKAAIPENAPNGSAARMEYGLAREMLNRYVDALKHADNRTVMKKFGDYIQNPRETFFKLASVTKSLKATFDNSFIGRQGIKMLLSIRNADLWAAGFLRSWKIGAKSLLGQDPMLVIKADILSRKNALNGKYEAGKFDLGVKYEEAFPSSAPEKIPLLGSLFRASEQAFNGTALRMRADYADRMIAKAEKYGVDTLNPQEMQGIGKLVNSMTGRGDIGRLSSIGEPVNAAFFSIRFLKSNFDILTAHALDFKMSRFAKIEAAKNLAGIVTSTAALMFFADKLWPGSVEWDSRSSKFGTITIGETTYDITGGVKGIATLASRITPTEHRGKWGFWLKSGKTERFIQLNSGKYGGLTAEDIINNYWEGKLSPVGGLIRDTYRGQDFYGEKMTATKALRSLTVPIQIETYLQLKEEDAADMLGDLIGEFIGFSSVRYDR